MPRLWLGEMVDPDLGPDSDDLCELESQDHSLRSRLAISDNFEEVYTMYTGIPLLYFNIQRFLEVSTGEAAGKF